MINHLFFSPLFFADALFFEHREILSVPLFAPRTPFSQVSSSLAHGLVAYRFAARSRTSRSPRLAATPSAVALLLFCTQKLRCLVAHASASLRHRLSLDFGRVSPPFHSGGTLPRLPCGRAHRLEQVLASKMFLKSHQCVNNSPLPLAERGGFSAARNHG